jgi:Domain of unknown function (DUF4330)
MFPVALKSPRHSQSFLNARYEPTSHDSLAPDSLLYVYCLSFFWRNIMAFLDKKGRLFGKISILDLGLALLLLVVLVGGFIVPGKSGQSAVQAQLNTKAIEIDAIVIGFNASKPTDILKEGDSTSIIIRNQPYGEIRLKKIQQLPKTVTASQPNGSVKAFPDPRPESRFSNNLILTLEGQGQVTKEGPVLGNIPVKVGVPIDLDGKLYNFRASIIDVRVKE